MHPKKSLLYIGNKLAVHGKNPTAIDRLPAKLEAEGYTVITASSKRNKLLRLWDMIITTIKSRKRVTMVLIDTYSTQNFYYAVIVASLCKLFALPYIPILHGGNLPNRLKTSRGLSKKLFAGARTNVAPSRYVEEEFKKAGFTNLTFIPNSIAIAHYPFKLRDSLSARLLWVRAFAEIYNPLLALQVVEELLKRNVEVSLCMVGPDKDGSLQACKQVAQDLNLPVSFTGKLEKNEWVALAAEYDIFINTTNFDNMPVSVMEAMALGLPVISTGVGGMPYLIEHGTHGILVPPNDAIRFADEIENMMANPIYAQQLSTAARVKVEQFGWEKIKDKWIKLLNL